MSYISALKNEKRRKEKELKQYIKRQEKVRDIAGDVVDVTDDYLPEIVSNARTAMDRFCSGLKAEWAVAVGRLDPVHQYNAYSDPDLSDCRSDLNREDSRIQEKIEDLRREIRNLEARIAAAREEED